MLFRSAAGLADVQVRNPDIQTATQTGGFTYVPAPSVTNVVPNSGTTLGGTAVTINGSNFQAGATVTIGGNAATSVNVVSATQITAVTPVGLAGAVAAQVRNPDNQTGSQASAFTYIAPPTISNVAPASGSTTGGTAITITGTNFVAGATVSLDGAAATTVIVSSGTTITAVTPAHPADVVDVTVRNLDGQAATRASSFTFLLPPTLISVAPNSGPAGGGTPVALTGTDFVAGATVTIGGAAATSVVVVSAMQITANTPAGSPGLADVVVQNLDGQTATLSAGFTFVAAPVISNINPTSGPSAGGTLVTINGSNFQIGATVQFGANGATAVNFVNSNQLTALAPAAGSAVPVDVRVTNPDGQFISSAGAYTYVAPPTVSSVSPTSGTSAGDTMVTVQGTGFLAGATVFFGDAVGDRKSVV